MANLNYFNGRMETGPQRTITRIVFMKSVCNIGCFANIIFIILAKKAIYICLGGHQLRTVRMTMVASILLAKNRMSCLFNSLAAFSSDPPQEIRRKICEFLATNAALYEDLTAEIAILFETGQTLATYVQRMRSPSTWGGAIEIRSYVLLWKKPVKVWDIRQRRWIEFPYNDSMENSVAILWTGGHYEPMR